MNIQPTSALDMEKRVGMTSGLLSLEGNQIHFKVAGHGLPIIFLHDGIADSRSFDDQFKFFAENYTVIRYDRHGYGLSKPPSVAYSEVNTLKSLFDQLGLEAAILIGGSAGGRLALNFAITHPTCVAALVLAGPAVSGLGFTDHMLNRGWRNEWGDSIPEYINFWVNDPWIIAEENTEERARLRQILESSNQNLINFPVDVIDDVEALPRLSEIHAPTIIILGESDIADNHAHAGVIQVNVKDSERKIIPHAAHLVFMEQPDKFNEIVKAFLEKHFPK